VREVGYVLIGLGVAAAIATQGLFLYAGRRKAEYGIEGDNLRMQPNRVALGGILSALFLLLAGGAFIGLSAL
jgi:hypothetical protein